MKTLHWHILRQVLVALAMTVFVFSLLLLLGTVVKQVLAVLVSGQASLGLAAEAIGYLIPYILTFALPFGMLAATLLVFGRISADNEVTAARAAGASLVSLVSPVILLSILLSALSAAINLEIAPRAKGAYKALLHKALTNPEILVNPRQFTRVGPFDIYAERVRGDDLYGVTIQERRKDSYIRYVRCDKATLTLDKTVETGKTAHSGEIVFYNANFFERLGSKAWKPVGYAPQHTNTIDVPIDLGRYRKKKLSELSWRELIQERRKIEDTYGEALSQQAKAGAIAKLEEFTSPVEVQLHSHASLSFACVGFTLIGIPLGIRAHRRETSVGVAMAIVMILIFYSFIVLGQALSASPELLPQFIVWIPNLIFQAVGAVMLARANRGV